MAKKAVKIEIDKNTCLGCGTCTVLSEKSFEIGEDGIAKVKTTWTEEEDEKLISAARGCPNAAIKVYDIEGKMIK